MLTANLGRPAAHTCRRAISPLARIRRALDGALALGRSRAALGDLDEHMLRDIGLTRDEARAEAERPIWDAPAYWFK